MVMLDVYCFKQSRDLFERLKLCRKHREPNKLLDSFLAALLELAINANCVRTVMRDFSLTICILVSKLLNK